MKVHVREHEQDSDTDRFYEIQVEPTKPYQFREFFGSRNDEGFDDRSCKVVDQNQQGCFVAIPPGNSPSLIENERDADETQRHPDDIEQQEKHQIEPEFQFPFYPETEEWNEQTE
jgi:hypothetical protein